MPFELNFEVVVSLQIDPETVGGAEGSGQPQGGVGADRPLAVNDFIDPARWHVDDLGQAVLTDGQRAETELTDVER